MEKAKNVVNRIINVLVEDYVPLGKKIIKWFI